LIKRLSISNGKIQNFNITRPQSKALKLYDRQKRQAKEERSRARVKFNNHFLKKRANKNGRLKGAVFTFSRVIEDDLSVSIPLVDRIYEHGGKYSQQIENCRYFVQTDGDQTARAVEARETEGVTVIDMQGLEELLNG